MGRPSDRCTLGELLRSIARWLAPLNRDQRTGADADREQDRQHYAPAAVGGGARETKIGRRAVGREPGCGRAALEGFGIWPRGLPLKDGRPGFLPQALQ